MSTIVGCHPYYLPSLRDRHEYLLKIQATMLHDAEGAISLGAVEGTLAASMVVAGYAREYPRGLLRVLLNYPGGPPEVYAARTRF